MSKTFIAVDRAGNRRLYLGNRLPPWWIRLSLRLHGWTAEPLITFRDRVAGPITERRSDGSYVIKAEGERFEIPAWIATLIEEAARDEGRREAVERIRLRLIEEGWREDSGDPDKGPVKVGWGSLESDIDRILDEVGK